MGDTATTTETAADDAPEADTSSTDAGTADKGFPVQTPVAEMTPQQQAAYWKDKARKHEERNRSYADYDDLKAKASEFDRLTESQKSDLEKLQGEADKHRAAAEKLEGQLLRRDVADDKGLPKGWASRLVGATRAELEADADNLLAELKPVTKPDADQGARGKGRTQPTVASGRDLYAQKHKPKQST